MSKDGLLTFLNSLEQKGIINTEANRQISNFLSSKNTSAGKLFLTLAAIIGALFASAGIFAIISHNWSDFPKHVRGVLSFIPSLVALFFYYKAVFKHRDSTSWIEASSLFLMLMIGASISLVSQTYNLDGDFSKFIKVWLFLTLPLFYIARASGIAIFYLGLSLFFLFPSFSFDFFLPSGYENNEEYLWFWLFFILYVPHFLMTLNWKSTIQSFRSVYLGWVTVVIIFLALPFAIKGGYLWWALSFIMGFYLIGKRFFSHNSTALSRPFQTFALFHIFYLLQYFSTEEISNALFRLEDIKEFGNWDKEHLIFYTIGLVAVLGLTILAFLWRLRSAVLNRAVVFVPVLFGLSFIIFCLMEYLDIDLTWWMFLIFNIYALTFGVIAMVQGNRSGSVLYMIYGLFLVCFILWSRYFDMDVSFWLKGIFFIIVGLLFFLIHFLSKEEFKD